MNFGNLFKGVEQGIGQGFSALGGAINNVENFFKAPNPYPGLKSPIPASNQMTHQMPAGVQSPIPQNQIAMHPAGQSFAQVTGNNVHNQIGNTMQGANNMMQGMGNNANQWAQALGFGNSSGSA